MIRIEINTEAVKRQLGALQADMPTVCRNALNDTAFGLKAHLTDLMRKTFPTAAPSTIKNISVRKADKDNLRAMVFFDQLYRKGLDEYMMPLIEGGGRSMKPSEKRLGQYWIPAYKSNPGMLNKYGNVPGGKVQQILSRLGKFNTSGFNMNQTAASKAKRRGAGKTTEYFELDHRRGGLAPGIYQRIQSAAGFGAKTAKGLSAGAYQKGRRKVAVRDSRGRITGYKTPDSKVSSVIRARGVKPVMLFVKQPRYSAMFPFFTSGQEYVDQTLPLKINTEIGWAIKRHMKRMGL
jgi:hypothetical protein